jgi:hypothetical protein
LFCSVTYNCGFGGSVSKAFAFSMLWISFERNWIRFLVEIIYESRTQVCTQTWHNR